MCCNPAGLTQFPKPPEDRWAADATSMRTLAAVGLRSTPSALPWLAVLLATAAAAAGGDPAEDAARAGVYGRTHLCVFVPVTGGSAKDRWLVHAALRSWASPARQRAAGARVLTTLQTSPYTSAFCPGRVFEQVSPPSQLPLLTPKRGQGWNRVVGVRDELLARATGPRATPGIRSYRAFTELKHSFGWSCQ